MKVSSDSIWVRDPSWPKPKPYYEDKKAGRLKFGNPRVYPQGIIHFDRTHLPQKKD